MSLEASVGIAEGNNALTVAKEAAEAAFDDIGHSPLDLVIIFSSPKYRPEDVVRGVREVVGPDVPLVGSTTAGEITDRGVAAHRSVIVMFLRSDMMTFYPAVSDGILEKGSFEAGRSVAEKIKTAADKDGKALESCIMFPDVLVGNGARIVEGVLDVFGKKIPIVGGASGDDQEFRKTYQFFNNTIHSGSVVGVGLAGKFTQGIGVRHGWVPIGAKMKVTKSTGSVVEEIENQPAIKVYEDHFGKENADLLKTSNALSTKSVLKYPFGITSNDEGEMLLRFALDVRNDGSIQCAASVPEGSDIQLMIGNQDEAIDAARDAATRSLDSLEGKKPKAVIIFNCIARRNLLGDDKNKEINAIQDVLGFDVPLIGFYTYGEQAPIHGEIKNIGTCETSFHNETVVIFTLSD